MGYFKNQMVQVMHDNGVTIADLAELTGRHRNTIANMRKGTPTVRLETLEAVANVLECSPYDLFVWIEGDRPE